MKILFLNAGYASGLSGRKLQYLTKFWRYFIPSRKSWQNLTLLLAKHSPDIVAFNEVDSGTLSRNKTTIRNLIKLKPYHATFRTKYRTQSILNKFPILKNQCNALFTTTEPVEHSFHDFKKGGHPLIIRTKLYHDLTFFVVHLALKKSVRKKQIEELKIIIKETSGRKIITGDFNTFGGYKEVEELVKYCELTSANKLNTPTFPAFKPKKEMDYIFVCKNTRITKFEVLKENISDHLPLLVEVE